MGSKNLGWLFFLWGSNTWMMSGRGWWWVEHLSWVEQLRWVKSGWWWPPHQSRSTHQSFAHHHHHHVECLGPIIQVLEVCVCVCVWLSFALFVVALLTIGACGSCLLVTFWIGPSKHRSERTNERKEPIHHHNVLLLTQYSTYVRRKTCSRLSWILGFAFGGGWKATTRYGIFELRAGMQCGSARVTTVTPHWQCGLDVGSSDTFELRAGMQCGSARVSTLTPHWQCGLDVGSMYCRPRRNVLVHYYRIFLHICFMPAGC